MKHCTAKKNKLYCDYFTNPSLLFLNRLKKYRNKFNHLLQSSKQKFYYNEFYFLIIFNNKDIKSTWKIIDEILNKNSASIDVQREFKGFNKILSDPLETANVFNKFFVNIGLSLADKITYTWLSFSSNKRPFFSFIFFSTSESELVDIINEVISNAPMLWWVKVSILKNCLPYIIQPLLKIFIFLLKLVYYLINWNGPMWFHFSKQMIHPYSSIRDQYLFFHFFQNISKTCLQLLI